MPKQKASNNRTHKKNDDDNKTFFSFSLYSFLNFSCKNRIGIQAKTGNCFDSLREELIRSIKKIRSYDRTLIRDNSSTAT